MLKTNLPNQIRQMPLPVWRPMLPVFEATMNAFQAIKEAKRPAGAITIEVHREPALLDLQNAAITGFTITDNGIGFNDRNFDSFNTLYTDHKMHEGGKGLGRFTWLKAFDHVKVETTFKEKEGHYRREFVFDEKYDIARGEAWVVSGSSTLASSQKPGGITPASGSAAARRSTSLSLMFLNARLKGLGGGMSSRLFYPTLCGVIGDWLRRRRFLLTWVGARLPSFGDCENDRA